MSVSALSRDLLGALASARILRLAPGIFALVATAAVLKASGVGFRAQLVYAAALFWSVLLPGILVHRAARGRPDMVVTDLALGAVTGMLLQLVAWAVFTASGLASWQGTWPAFPLVAFLAVPRLRGHLTLAAYPRVLPATAAWVAVAAGVLPLLSALRGLFTQNVLPPGSLAWYPDLNWYLGAAAELMRTVTPQVAQVVGDPFHYHWFSQASMAAMAHTTGLDLTVVVARLWLPVAIWLLVGMAVALTDKLSGRAWAGSLAALLITLEGYVAISSWFRLPGFETMTFLSPSQIYTIPILFLVLILIGDLARGRVLGPGGWALLALGLLGCAGGKSSALPVVLCASLLVAVIVWVAGRRGWVLEGGVSLRGALAALIAVAVAQVVGLYFAGAGGAGGGIKLFAVFGITRPWQLQYGREPEIYFREPLLHLPSANSWVFLAALVVLVALGAGFAATGVFVVRRIEAWLLFGVGFAGFCGMMLVNHSGYSQAYFLRGAVPALHVLAAWGAGEAWARATRFSSRSRVASLALLGGSIGATMGWAGSLLTALPAEGQAARPTVIVALATAVLVLALALTLRSRPWQVGVLGSAALLGLALRAPLGSSLAMVDPAWQERAWLWGALVLLTALTLIRAVTWRPAGGEAAWWVATVAFALPSALFLVVALMTYPGQPTQAPPGAQSAEQIAAARWVAAEAEPFDLVATNVHCLNPPTRPGCDSRSFWVSGHTQRRVLVEGWGYTTQAHEQHGVDGVSSRAVPFHDQELLAINEAAFYTPTDEAMEALRGLGVRWLFADATAGPLSGDIGRYAELAHESGSVRIYRLA